jgi:hypothetical protein
MKKTNGLLFVFLCLQMSVLAQIGGESVYTFTTLPHTARLTALGGNAIVTRDDDVALAYHNPATLNAAMHGQLSFSHSFYFANIQHGYFGYGQHLRKSGITLHGGVQYINYGDFQGTTFTGQTTNTFTAAENAFVLGAAKRYNERLSFGANIKLLNSRFEAYRSVGIAGDLGVFREDTARRLNMSLVFRNIGTQLSTYQPDNVEKLPFDLQFGISKRLEHLPFRFSIIVHNLHRWDILYNDPNLDEPVLVIGDNAPKKDNVFFDNLFRHFNFNGEFFMGKKENFRLRAGYSHLRRAELSVRNTVSFAGFSFGVGLKVNRFRLDYGRGTYHLAGATNHFTISTNFKEFQR